MEVEKMSKEIIRKHLIEALDAAEDAYSQMDSVGMNHAFSSFYEAKLKKGLDQLRVTIEHLDKIESLLPESSEEERTSVMKFLGSLTGMHQTCNSCKFYETKTGHCLVHNINRPPGAPKCDQWRYFG